VSSSSSGLQNPSGLAFDSAGNLSVASDGIANFIEKFDTNGVATSLIFASLSNPQGMAVDSAGNLFVANNYGSTIQKFDTNGVASLFTTLTAPFGLAFDSEGNLYAASSFENTISKFDTNANGSIFATNGLMTPQGLAIDSLGNLYAVNGNTNHIAKFTSGGAFSIFATNGAIFGTFGPDLAIDSANNVYALTNYFGIGIGKYSPAGVLSPFATNTGPGLVLANAQGMAFDSAGNLYVANYYGGTVEKFDTSGHGTVFASGLLAPTSLAIRRNGNLVLPPVLAIIKSGTNTVLSWPAAASSYNLKSATNLASPVWLPVSGTLFTNGGNLVLTNAMSGPVRFFRLSNP
jgi:sugar lactone lactonase YvrE